MPCSGQQARRLLPRPLLSAFSTTSWVATLLVGKALVIFSDTNSPVAFRARIGCSSLAWIGHLHGGTRKSKQRQARRRRRESSIVETPATSTSAHQISYRGVPWLSLVKVDASLWRTTCKPLRHFGAVTSPTYAVSPRTTGMSLTAGRLTLL